MLPPYIKLSLPQGDTGDSTSSYSVIPCIKATLSGRCWAVRPSLQDNSSNCLVLIPHRQLGNYLLCTWESCGQTAQHSLFLQFSHVEWLHLLATAD